MSENQTEPEEWQILLAIAGEHLRAGELDEALSICNEAQECAPEIAEVHISSGYVQEQLGRLDEAVASYETAIRIRPDYAEAWSSLGDARRKQADFGKAIEAYRRALALKPNLPQTLNNLGTTFRTIGQDDKALLCFRQCLLVHPEFTVARANLAALLGETGHFDEAIGLCRQILSEHPDLATIHNSLGNALRDIGQIAEAIASYENAVRIDPGYTTADSNRVYAINFSPAHNSTEIYRELNRWNDRHAEPLREFIQPHTNDRDPDRRLRIGYVSPDFRSHVIGRNLLPLFRHHDRRSFEIICYAHVRRSDAMTKYFQQMADGWHNIGGLSDEQVAQQVRQDRIDILVDLTMHMSLNRLLVFARKPAPVQVTFVGYPGSTGLKTIDHRLTDPYLDPPGMDESIYSERSVRLPDTFWCYDPMENRDIPANSLPAPEAGFVTFGCLNSFSKVNEQTLRLWGELLKTVDRSRLLILCPEGSARQSVLAILQGQGIDPDRIELFARLPLAEYFTIYHRIDIGLDTLPYNGHTTSLDSFWMGVPVITLVGKTVVGRAGLSQLTNLGLTELIAHTPQQFVQIASELAADLPRLAELRRSLRARIQGSPLMDDRSFARNIEEAYRTMWTSWCAS